MKHDGSQPLPGRKGKGQSGFKDVGQPGFLIAIVAVPEDGKRMNDRYPQRTTSSIGFLTAGAAAKKSSAEPLM
jgi:hypothetical protein